MVIAAGVYCSACVLVIIGCFLVDLIMLNQALWRYIEVLNGAYYASCIDDLACENRQFSGDNEFLRYQFCFSILIGVSWG